MGQLFKIWCDKCGTIKEAENYNGYQFNLEDYEFIDEEGLNDTILCKDCYEKYIYLKKKLIKSSIDVLQETFWSDWEKKDE